MIVLGIGVCAWFVLGARQAHDMGAAAPIATANSVTPAQAKHFRSLLDAAGTLNPDREVDVLRGSLEAAEGRHVKARQTLFRVIREEPKNLDAWLAYARASSDSPKAFFAAQIGIRRLVPRIPTQR